MLQYHHLGLHNFTIGAMINERMHARIQEDAYALTQERTQPHTDTFTRTHSHFHKRERTLAYVHVFSHLTHTHFPMIL